MVCVSVCEALVIAGLAHRAAHREGGEAYGSVALASGSGGGSGSESGAGIVGDGGADATLVADMAESASGEGWKARAALRASVSGQVSGM